MGVPLPELPPPLCPIRTPGPYPQQAHRCWIFRQRWFLYPGAPRTFPGDLGRLPGCVQIRTRWRICTNARVLFKSAGACGFGRLPGASQIGRRLPIYPLAWALEIRQRCRICCFPRILDSSPPGRLHPLKIPLKNL